MNMNSQVGISEDQLANRRKDNMMKVTISRAAKRADQIVAAIADRLNGNAARRRTIKQRLTVAMMATERHTLLLLEPPRSAPPASPRVTTFSNGALSFTAPQFDNRVEPSHA